MADVPTPKLPDTKRLEFLAFIIWIGLIGAVLILLIDYQIKQAILRESEKAWKGIHGFEASQRGSSHTANSAGDNPSGVLSSHGPEMETRIVVEGVSDPSAANGHEPFRQVPRANPRRGTRRPSVPPGSEPVEP